MSINIALAGNPNCGKTTMFNELTGANQYVGNWPGVTVEKKMGKYNKDKDITITDLPGVYSLSPYTPEEIVTRDFLMSGKPDVVINLVDATNLERNLYLTTQILNLGLPVVIALNMMDLVEKNGDRIDVAKLSAKLGCPIVETSALRGRGLEQVISVAREAAAKGAAASDNLRFADNVEMALAKVIDLIGNRVKHANVRWFATKLLEDEQMTLNAMNLTNAEMSQLAAIREALEDEMDDDTESIITNERYEVITEVCADCVKKSPKAMTTTQKIDRIVTNRVLGLPIFIAIMFCVYYVAVSLGGGIVTDWANDGISGDGWDYWGVWIPGLTPIVSGALEAVGAAPWLQSLLVDGVVAGVGAVIGFVPQLILLFIMLAFLEGCGYMARVAFIMDRLFRRFGLSGKSFIPMLIASGCGVPAVMATKTIESEKDRRMTIMTTTMIPCGAKMPIIALVFGALAGGDVESTWWVAPVFYFMGLAAIIISCIMLKKLRAFAGEAAPFIMELPQYHLPTFKNVMLSMWERVKSYIVKAGTIIFLSTIVIWFLMNFGIYEGAFGMLDPEMEGYLNYSFMAMLGSALAWIFAPLGFGTWESTVTAVTGLVAKENVVATVGVLTSLADMGEADPSLWEGFALMLGGSSAAIMAFCAFNLLCAPCFAAIGTIWRQMGNAKWTWATIGYMTGFGWCVGLMIYQFGGLIMGEVAFNLWTVVALVIAAGMLFQLFRPIPNYAEKDAKRAGKLEAEATAA